MGKHPEEHTVKAWSANAIAFIEDKGLTREFNDWCGGWPCPVSPQMVSAAPALVEALEPFAFVGEDCPKDTQAVWEMIYRDRVQDWFSYEDFERARAALTKVGEVK